MIDNLIEMKNYLLQGKEYSSSSQGHNNKGVIKKITKCHSYIVPDFDSCKILFYISKREALSNSIMNLDENKTF